MNYQTKNNSYLVWVFPIIILILNFSIQHSFFRNYPGIIISLGASIFLFLRYKDSGVFINNNKLIIKKTSSDNIEYLPEEITSYRITKDVTNPFKTTLRVQSQKSEIEYTLYLLNFDGFENAMKSFLTIK